jgi:hypothetical protein
MERDMDLIRRLLLRIEANDKAPLRVADLSEADPQDAVLYHLQLIDEAGLIKATPLAVDAGVVDYLVDRLTWQGHEFVDAARDDRTWTRVKEVIAEKVRTVPFELLVPLMIELLKTKFHLA